MLIIQEIQYGIYGKFLYYLHNWNYSKIKSLFKYRKKDTAYLQWYLGASLQEALVNLISKKWVTKDLTSPTMLLKALSSDHLDDHYCLLCWSLLGSQISFFSLWSAILFTTRHNLHGLSYKITFLWLTRLLKFFLLWIFFFTAKEDLLVTTLATTGQCSDSLLFLITAPLSSSSSTITAPLSEYTLRNQNNSWGWGLAGHEKKGWTGAETQLLGPPQTWPFLSVSWVISSGPFLSNWDENLLFYLSPSAPLVSKVYLYPFGFVTGSEGEDKVKLMEPA